MKRIVGYAIVWDSDSVNFSGYIETIKRSALDGVISTSDVFALLDHNKSLGVMARSTNGRGSLKLEVDTHGLRYVFVPPSTAAGVIESIERGDLRGCSFSFSLNEGGDVWTKVGPGEFRRTIIQIAGLHDVTMAYSPCYPATEVHVE